MRILVLGGYGGMGSVAVHDLIDSKVDEIVIAGRDLQKAKALAEKYKSTSAIEMDALDKNLWQEIKFVKPDVVINAVQYQFNLQIMKAAIKAKVDYVDLGGLYHMTLKQLKLHNSARKADVLCLLGMGSTPGTLNVMAGYAAQKFDSIKKVELRSGWRVLDKLEKPVIPYSADTIYDEFAMPAPVLRNGKIRFVNPMEKRIDFEFAKPLGKVSGHYAIHSELATLPKSINKGVREMDFAVAYPKEFTNLVANTIKKYKDKKKVIAELENKTILPKKEPRDIDGQRVEIFGSKKGKPLRVGLDIITTFYEKWRLGSSIDTGVPPSIAAQWIASGKVKAKGAVPPEIAFKNLELKFFKELYRHTGGNMRVWEFVNNSKGKKLF